MIPNDIDRWCWYTDGNTSRLYIHLLIKANYKQKVWRGITIERGQVLTSRQSLSRELGMTEQEIRTAISHLKSTNDITCKSTNKYTLITICNLVDYTEEKNENNQQINTQNNQQTTSKQPTNNQQTTTTNIYISKKDNTNKEKNNINVIQKEKKEQTKKFDFKGTLLALGVSEPIADEWISIRKKKRGTNSEFALKTIVNEANKAGISLQEAVEFAAKRQWVGFQADWYFNSQYSMKPTQGGGRGFMSDAEAQAICDAGLKLHEFIGRNRQ